MGGWVGGKWRVGSWREPVEGMSSHITKSSRVAGNKDVS